MNTTAMNKVTAATPFEIIARIGDDAARPRSGGSSFGKRVAAFAARLVESPRRWMVTRELHAMTDRALADIGLARHDIRHVFETDFGARHDAKREARANG
jgi:uncharacterized protein YjiS (DUF1127 family)